MRRGSRLLALSLLSAALVCHAAPPSSLPLDRIRLPEGFAIDLVARVPGAREMTAGPGGVVFVGTREDSVFAVIPGAAGQARVITVAKGLDSPNGVAWRDGALYVAEISRILRYDRIEEWLRDPRRPLAPVIVTDKLPKETAHGWKFIAFGPDGLLYVPVGAPCNICEPGDPYASLLRMKPDGSGIETFARGIRNTVGFDWSPVDGALWFTDNGRDRLGDDVPPDELNRAPRAGLHFGYPYCHGGTIPDPRFGSRGCSGFEPPAQKLGAHVASLGMRFYNGTAFPPPWRGQIFIAEHGSWDRSIPIGYRVTVVRLDGNRPVSYEPFADGWLQSGRAWGRPVDVLVAPDGSLLVSDDTAGAIYRIRSTSPPAAR